MSLNALLDNTIYYDPAHAEHELVIIWDRGGEPFALVIDGRSYRVRRSPRLALRLGEGGRVQTLWEQVRVEPSVAEDGLPTG